MIDGPITSVKLFTIDSTGMRCPCNYYTAAHPLLPAGAADSLADYHLLVTSAVELAAVFL